MKYVKLKDICTIVSGGTPKTSDPDNWDGEYIWITPAEINDDSYIINDSKRHITEKGASKLSSFPKGTVILSSRAPIGKVAIAGTEMYCNQGFKNLICSSRINNEYLYWYLKNKTQFLNSLGRGATFKEISKSIVGNIEVPLPELDVQLKIVEVMKKIIDVMATRKRTLDKLDTLIKARFVEMFEGNNYTKRTLEEVCINIVDCPHSTPKYEGKLLYPAIRTTEIKSGYIDWSTMKYVSKNEYIKRTSRLVPEPGDIVYGREGTYGNAVVLPPDINFCLGQRVMLFRPNTQVCLSEYLLYSILSDSVKQQADAKNVGATVPHVNVADAKKFKILVPPIIKQNEFVYFVHQVDKSKVVVKKISKFHNISQEMCVND
ncbi:restriction endonuclease subunit S [Lactobacillus porci]|uniref:restriction endonuclease subunit S n=1 Tax=Lactobacillus porci TaxID=2012477 RepID=UPI00399448B8